MELHSLNRPRKANKYCGPAVLSFLTGINTSECASWFRLYSRHRGAVRGTRVTDMKLVLDQLGFRLREVSNHDEVKAGRRPTLASWLKAHKSLRTPGRVYLLVAGNHWQLITGSRYACGRVGGIVSIRAKCVKRRARVQTAWELLPK